MDRFDIEQDFVTTHDQPNLTFEEASYTLHELLDSHLLPVVAQYDNVKQPIPFNEFNFDLSQPLLLYKKRHIQKVAARSLHIEDDRYQEVGESLLIPEDYKGWFAVLQRITGNTKADDTIPHFTSVEEVANSNTDRFLIGGTKKISGLQLLERSDADLKHEQRHFHPGDVLTREKIYYGETKKRTRLFRKPKYITEKFLMCRDETDREILLPFEQTGIFYQISHKAGKANRHVMQMSDIVARKLTPRIIKLVFGRFPVTPCSFTGLMKADSSRIETSIIASTLINKKNILMEIPVSSAIYFRVAVMNNELRRNVCYRNAMSLCAERAITYMRNIKVCYNFTVENDFEDGGSSNQTNVWNRTGSCLPENQSSGEILNFINNNNINCDGSKESSIDFSDKRSRTCDVTEKVGFYRGNSFDIPEDITVRPGRSMSTGRMSFCLGNSYLTLPMFQNGNLSSKNSANNNSSHDMIYTTKRGSKLSFNGTFFEEAEEETEPDEVSTAEDEITVPPPLPCTTISSYVNAILPPSNEFTECADCSDYISACGSRRPSTQPPETAPPPLPRSSSTSGVSSGSSSSVSDETIAKRSSSDSFEYAVPKIQDPNTILSDLSEAARISNGTSHNDKDKPRLRRPSTFTFSEGCVGPFQKNKKQNSIKTLDENVNEHVSEDSSPIYENIQKLMEMVAKLESQEHESTEERRDTSIFDTNHSVDELEDAELSREALDTRIETSNGANPMTYITGTPIETCLEETDISQDRVMSSSRTSSPQEYGSTEILANNNLCESSTINMADDNVKPKQRRNGVTQLEEYDLTINNNEAVWKEKICSDGESSVDHSDPELTREEDTTQVVVERCGVETSVIEIIVKTKASDCKQRDAQIEYADKVLENGVEMNSDVFDKHDIAAARIAEEDMQNGVISYTTDVSNNHTFTVSNSAIEKVKQSKESSWSKIREIEKPLHCLTVDEVAKELTAIGIKEATVEHIKILAVDGAKLSEVLDGDVLIRDYLVGVNLVDQQKISMFIRGWRPNCE